MCLPPFVSLRVVTNTISSYPATYTLYEYNWGDFHVIQLGNGLSATYLYVYTHGWGMDFNAYGCESFLGGAEGMCGSFDQGGINDSRGRPRTILTYDWSNWDWEVYYATYLANLNLGAVMAQSWMIDPDESMFSDPSTICDASSSCGNPGDAFTCEATRRHLQVSPGCTRNSMCILFQRRQFMGLCSCI